MSALDAASAFAIVVLLTAALSKRRKPISRDAEKLARVITFPSKTK